ncbi:MAG: MoaD/ThiS family protein [Actinomycetota bacterium]
MRVRLFAILRELAGSSEVEADGSSVEQVVQILCDRYGERFTQVIRSSQVVVDGEVAPLDLSLEGKEQVALLPPVSGG